MPRKTLLRTGGYDGTCEELFFIIARGALERGYNILMFDGPGQGGALVIQKLPMRADWEKVVTPVVDYLLTRPDVDSARIALYGGSFGGYLAPRAVAFEHRLAACIADAALFDPAALSNKMFPPEVASALTKNDVAVLEPFFNQLQEKKSLRRIRSPAWRRISNVPPLWMRPKTIGGAVAARICTTRYNVLSSTCCLRRMRGLVSTARPAHARYFFKRCLTGLIRSLPDDRHRRRLRSLHRLVR